MSNQGGTHVVNLDKRSPVVAPPIRATVSVGRWPKIPWPEIPDSTFPPTTATLLSGPTEAVLIDALYLKDDVRDLGDLIERTGKSLTTIYITHAHADHYAGIGPLLERFPDAKCVAMYVLRHTPYGRYLASVGASPTSARLVGLNVPRVILSSFVFSGALSGIAGLVLLARAGTANPQVGPGYTLAALSAAFLGATAIRPGTFNVVGTLLGVLFVAVSVNGLVLAGAADWVEPTFNGAALLVAVTLSTALARRRAGRT
jgi:hypothetical protein